MELQVWMSIQSHRPWVELSRMMSVKRLELHQSRVVAPMAW